MVSGGTVISITRLHIALHVTDRGFYSQNVIIFIQPLEPVYTVLSIVKSGNILREKGILYCHHMASAYIILSPYQCCLNSSILISTDTSSEYQIFFVWIPVFEYRYPEHHE